MILTSVLIHLKLNPLKLPDKFSREDTPAPIRGNVTPARRLSLVIPRKKNKKTLCGIGRKMFLFRRRRIGCKMLKTLSSVFREFSTFYRDSEKTAILGHPPPEGHFCPLGSIYPFFKSFPAPVPIMFPFKKRLLRHSVFCRM